MRKANWYFDFISPFAYLQLAKFSELPSNLDILPVPVLFSGLLKHWGQLGPAEIPPKRRFVYRFFQWNANQLGIPFAMPSRHPFNPLPPLRLCLAAGSRIENIQTVFDMIYGEGLQPDAPEGIDAIARALSISNPEAAMSDPQVKQTLQLNTDKAIADDVFGVPTFVLDGQLFWGGDATDMMLHYLMDPTLFETSEMKRISEMPMGMKRQK